MEMMPQKIDGKAGQNPINPSAGKKHARTVRHEWNSKRN